MPATEEVPLSKTLRHGVLAALATPVDAEGRPDLGTFASLIEFVTERDVDGVVIGGATGEYASLSIEQRARLIQEACKRAGERYAVLAGIGAQTLSATLSLARVAAESGCRAVLLSMPYFFRYQQDDLQEYCRAVSEAVRLPCFLYHLPSFTNGLELDRVVELFDSGVRLAGIKDSSGDRRDLAVLAQARAGRRFDLFVGDDSLALDAFQAGWDGVISGIACFLPELLVALAVSFRAGDLPAARRCQDDLDRVIEELIKLPIPWAVRIGLEARGISPGPLPLPLSGLRQRQVSAYLDWCRQWLSEKAWLRP